MANFTSDWTTHNLANWERWLGHLKGQPAKGLEVGCYEGRSSVWFLDNILTHPDSELVVIDTFKGSPEFAGMDVMQRDIFKRFSKNIDPYGAKVRTFVGESGVVLRHDSEFNRNPGDYDFAYIDGSHEAPDVLADAVLVFDLVKPGGIIIFDDYKWDMGDGVKKAVMGFMVCYGDKIKTVETNYQLMIVKK
jgi:predicted O-methyltransferase YrrM